MNDDYGWMSMDEDEHAASNRCLREMTWMELQCEEGIMSMTNELMGEEITEPMDARRDGFRYHKGQQSFLLNIFSLVLLISSHCFNVATY